jgi:hypothetical protein
MAIGREPWQRGYPIDLRSPEVVRRDAAGPYGDFEARAARIVARATGMKTIIQDDNRVPRTPDFRLEHEGRVLGVGEVVTTTRGDRAEQLRAFARGELDFESDALTCTWWVTVRPEADRRRLRGSLVPLLARMEADGGHLDFTGSLDASRANSSVGRFHELGISEAVCDPHPRQGPGRVLGLLPGIGGAQQLDWNGFYYWLDSFLTSDICLRKRDKLVRSAAVDERHLFVGITWSAPWSVLRVLEHDVRDVPVRSPTFPIGVTHLWLHGAELPSRCIAWWPDVGWFDVQQRWVTA